MPVLLCLVVLVCAPVAVLRAAGGSGPPGLSADIRIGFGGYVVPDVWIPASVILRSDRALEGTVEVITARTRPAATERVRLRVRLLAGTPHLVTLPVTIGDLRQPVKVRLLEGARPLAEWRVVIPTARLADALVLALSDRPIGLQRLLTAAPRSQVAYLREEDLPVYWQMYDGVQAVVIRDLDDRRLTPTQAEALAGWVAAGGRVAVVAAPAAEILSRATLRPFLDTTPLPPRDASAALRIHPWGRGEIAVIPFDPFRPDLDPEATAAWTRIFTALPAPALADRTLLDVLPPSMGTSLLVQVLVALTLGAYLVLLRPLTRWLQRGRPGWLLAALLFGAITLAAAVLSAVMRREMSAIVQGSVAEVLSERGEARVETYGRIVLPQGGAFHVRSTPDTLVHPLGAADTSLELAEEVRLGGTAPSTLAVRATTMIPLAVRGTYRETAQGVEVEIHNRTGRVLVDPVVFLEGRVQPLPTIGTVARVALSPSGWREPPGLEVARGVRARILAWAFGRLSAGAIINRTIYIVAWLHDERGVLRWDGRPAAPLLVVLPLSRAPGGAP